MAVVNVDLLDALSRMTKFLKIANGRHSNPEPPAQEAELPSGLRPSYSGVLHGELRANLTQAIGVALLITLAAAFNFCNSAKVRGMACPLCLVDRSLLNGGPRNLVLP